MVQTTALFGMHHHVPSWFLTTCMRGGHLGNQGGTRLDAAGEGYARGKAEVADIREVPTHHLQAHRGKIANSSW